MYHWVFVPLYVFISAQFVFFLSGVKGTINIKQMLADALFKDDVPVFPFC